MRLPLSIDSQCCPDIKTNHPPTTLNWGKSNSCSHSSYLPYLPTVTHNKQNRIIRSRSRRVMNFSYKFASSAKFSPSLRLPATPSHIARFLFYHRNWKTVVNNQLLIEFFAHQSQFGGLVFSLIYSLTLRLVLSSIQSSRWPSQHHPHPETLYVGVPLQIDETTIRET